MSTVPSEPQQKFLAKLKVTNPSSITTKDAARYLSEFHGIPTAPSSLEVYRCSGRGPKYKKIGSRVFYALPWLDDYAAGIEVKIFDPSMSRNRMPANISIEQLQDLH